MVSLVINKTPLFVLWEFVKQICIRENPRGESAKEGVFKESNNFFAEPTELNLIWSLCWACFKMFIVTHVLVWNCHKGCLQSSAFLAWGINHLHPTPCCGSSKQAKWQDLYTVIWGCSKICLHNLLPPVCRQWIGGGFYHSPPEGDSPKTLPIFYFIY